MSGYSSSSCVWPVAAEKVPGGHREQSASDGRVAPVQHNERYDLWDAGDAAIEFLAPLVQKSKCDRLRGCVSALEFSFHVCMRRMLWRPSL